MLVTTHEVHHMHFGDTVTMRDWSQEYLNEGFTRFAQNYGVDDLAPKFDMTCLTGKSQGTRNNFYQFSYEVAMTFDTPGTAPSIVYPIRGGGDIPPFPPTGGLDSEDPTKAPLFARIFYEKGASINRMIATLLGWEEWFAALSEELKRHTWQNPTVEDMMRSLDDSFVAMGLPTAVDAMLPWLQRPGYPVVTLSVVNGSKLVAKQIPVSPYLKNQSPWWIPLQVYTSHISATSNANHTSALLSFNTTSAMMEFNAPLSELVGDPLFYGFFIVRYDTDALWNSRLLSATKKHIDSPDYTRCLLFQLTLLVEMSHERTQRLSDALSVFTPILASNPRLGGWEGESALYEMIMKRTTPIIATLGSCGELCTQAHDNLSGVLRKMIGDLARRLTWQEESKATVRLENRSNKLVPWPTTEDFGMATRDENVLRPLAVLNAVIYNDTGAVEQGIAIFRNASTTGVVQGPFARAAYFAAAKYGSNDDRTSLITLLSAVNGTDAANVLFGLTASASSLRCPDALQLVSNKSSSVSLDVQMAALVDMLTYATDCHEVLVTAVVALAEEMWKNGGYGQNATPAVKEALNQFCTKYGLDQAMILCLKFSQFISALDAHAVAVKIQINMDAIRNNNNA
jgi:hypothetical protein